jgi:sugar lactone lactonase YvrE
LKLRKPSASPPDLFFTEGPLWHPEGYWYFVDIQQNKLFRLTPGKEPEVVGMRDREIPPASFTAH